MAIHRQHSTPGGHLVVCEADVADGHVVIESTWQTIVDEWLGETGSTLTERRAYLNGALVKDPELAQRLWREVLSQ
jgi:hypothetical protein